MKKSVLIAFGFFCAFQAQARCLNIAGTYHYDSSFCDSSSHFKGWAPPLFTGVNNVDGYENNDFVVEQTGCNDFKITNVDSAGQLIISRIGHAIEGRSASQPYVGDLKFKLHFQESRIRGAYSYIGGPAFYRDSFKIEKKPDGSLVFKYSGWSINAIDNDNGFSRITCTFPKLK